MVTNPTAPSYAAIVNQGATTLWENLTGSGGSKDHQFLGDVAAWLVHDLAGIDQAPGSRQYRQLIIRPAIVGGLTHAAGSYTTPAGAAAVSWTASPGGHVTLEATVPANTTAEIWVPASGQPATAPPGVTFSRTGTFDGTQYAVYDAGSGTYRFTGNAS
jgi:alpha-L-rhamnosidase